MRNSIIIAFFGILLTGVFVIFPSQSFAYVPEEATWQLIVISSEPVCTIAHYHMLEKYNEITREYLDLYKLFHGSYQPECFSEDEFIEQYEKPYDLDLLILVFDKEKGMAELHSHNTGGVYIHQGNDLSTNHNVIICDCPNFKYSDPVWILSHELSHFVLNYLGFDLDKVEETIHGLDYKFDSCVEGEYSDLCSTIKTRVETYRAFWTVMIPYEPAIGREPPAPKVQKVSFESQYQSAMIKEITNWWMDGEISDENYIKSLKILSGKEGNNDVVPNGVFKNSAFLMLTEPKHDIVNQTLSKYDSDKLTENFLKVNLSITKNQTDFSSYDRDVFLEWLKIKANSWKENKINDKEFLSNLATLLDSPEPSLFLKYLENLTFEELISKGEEYQKLGDYRNALSFYDQAIFASIDSSEIKKTTALIGKGAVLTAMGEYDNAIEHYDLALEIDPDNVELLKKKAFILAQLGSIDEAREYYEAANQLSSK